MQRRMPSPELPRTTQQPYDYGQNARNDNVVLSSPIFDSHFSPYAAYPAYAPQVAPQPYLSPLDAGFAPPFPGYFPAATQQLFAPQPYAPYPAAHDPARLLHPHNNNNNVSESPINSIDNFENNLISRDNSVAGINEHDDSISERDDLADRDPFERNASYVEGTIGENGKKVRRKRANKNEVPLDFASRKVSNTLHV